MVQRDHDGVSEGGDARAPRLVVPDLEEFWPGRRADDFDEFCPG